MKPQIQYPVQDEQQQEADQFNVWLSSPEGQVWLEDTEQEQEERQVLSVWEGW